MGVTNQNSQPDAMATIMDRVYQGEVIASEPENARLFIRFKNLGLITVRTAIGCILPRTNTVKGFAMKEPVEINSALCTQSDCPVKSHCIAFIPADQLVGSTVQIPELIKIEP